MKRVARASLTPATLSLASLPLAALLMLVAGTAAASEAELVAAARTGDGATVRALLRRETPADAQHVDGTTALHWAVRNDDRDTAAALLGAGADPRAANRYGITPLHLAAQNGSAAMIALLLEAGADANEIGIEGESVLMTAARTGVVDAARVLLERGANVNHREGWHGQTALMWAAAQRHPAMLSLLLEHGADVNARSDIREWERQSTDEPRAKWMPLGGLSPLLFAAREGCPACVPVLAEAGAELDTATPEGVSAVISALINGHFDTAAALIEAGVDPNLADETGRTALYSAIDFSVMPASNRPAPYVLDNTLTALDVAARLLEHGADVNAQLRRMVPYRAKLDRGNDTALNGGSTAFLRAAKAADVPAMQLLLDHGADVTLTNANGINALMIAAGVGTSDSDAIGRFKTEAQIIAAIDLCLEAGLDIDAVDDRGRTALHGAALQGFDDVIRHLARRGARLDIADSRGFTPLDTALGLAGGFGFSGREGVVREDTAALIAGLAAGTIEP
jgi:uncharacterized protein